MSPHPRRTWGGAALLLWRALRRRCPRCGASAVWASWTRLHDHCPRCGLQLDRGESDHFYGGYALNFIAAEVAVVLAFAVSLIVTWPTPPWNAILVGAIVLAVIAPLVLYPVTKGLWIGVDLMFRPGEDEAIR